MITLDAVNPGASSDLAMPIGQDSPLAAVEEHVARLNIAMHDPLPVCFIQGSANISC